MTEYTNKPVLVNLAKCHSVQLPLQYNLDMLHTLIASHLSGGDCVDSNADGFIQLVSSFCVKSDVPFVLTKLKFQNQILLSILHLVRLCPLWQILLCLQVSVDLDVSFTKLCREFCKCITRLNHGK